MSNFRDRFRPKRVSVAMSEDVKDALVKLVRTDRLLANICGDGAREALLVRAEDELRGKV